MPILQRDGYRTIIERPHIHFGQRVGAASPRRCITVLMILVVRRCLGVVRLVFVRHLKGSASGRFVPCRYGARR
jgi:hypothetical protein